MKYYGRAQEVTNKIVEAFQSGNVPAPLAQVFIRADIPMQAWSVTNQFCCLISGCTDARGFKQWKRAGRYVKEGEEAAAHILVPLKRRVRDEGEEEVLITWGFKTAAVFDVSQTDGEPLPDVVSRQAQFVANLPLLAVAGAFGVDVTTYSGQAGGYLGYYSSASQLIALGVENLSTWFHELVHAAEDRLGSKAERGQHWRSEVVAELGGATLAVMLGLQVQADVGGAWAYVQQYATAAGISPIAACLEVLDRIAQAIQLILDTADSVLCEKKESV